LVALSAFQDEISAAPDVPADPDALVRATLLEARDLTDALDAELWASRLLGLLWMQRGNLARADAAPSEYVLAYGTPLIEDLARAGGPSVLSALVAIAAVDDGELGVQAASVVETMLDRHEPVPRWLVDVGQAEITAAAVMRERVFDDAFTVFVEARHPSGEIHAIGVLIDNNFGVMAKDVVLADSIERVEEVVDQHPQPDGELRLDPVEPGQAAAQIRAAIDLTDMTVSPPVSKDYADLRAIALMRAYAVPEGEVVVGRVQVPLSERDRLIADFLASPEGEGYAADGDEAFAVSLAVDFCADYADGRPLRWSPAVVELFMADWIPGKELTNGIALDRLPAALDAWVRYAGRRRSTPPWAVALTRRAIPRWRDAMTGSTTSLAAWKARRAAG
jgi:hypothetical protein